MHTSQRFNNEQAKLAIKLTAGELKSSLFILNEAFQFALAKVPIFRSGIQEVCTLIIDYANSSLLGLGGSANVLPAYLIDLETYRFSFEPNFAIKIAKPPAKITDAEIEIMRNSRSIKIYWHGMLGDQSCCLMEYFAPHYLRPITSYRVDITQRLNYIVSICTQIQNLHEHFHVTHGDIKLENTLIMPPKSGLDVSGNIFLIDYGLSQKIIPFEDFKRVIEHGGFAHPGNPPALLNFHKYQIQLGDKSFNFAIPQKIFMLMITTFYIFHTWSIQFIFHPKQNILYFA